MVHPMLLKQPMSYQGCASCGRSSHGVDTFMAHREGRGRVGRDGKLGRQERVGEGSNSGALTLGKTAPLARGQRRV